VELNVNIPGSICGFLDMASSGVSAGLKTTGPFETVASPVGSNKLAYSERPEPLAGGFGFEGFDIVRVRVYDLKLLNASSSWGLKVQPCEAWACASQPSRFHMAPFPSDLGSLCDKAQTSPDDSEFGGWGSCQKKFDVKYF
jgi:hypothetical protein